MNGWTRVTAPPMPRRPSVIRWEALHGGPDLADPAYPSKTAFRFPQGGPWEFFLSGISSTVPLGSMRSGRRLTEQPHQDDSPVGDQDDSTDEMGGGDDALLPLCRTGRTRLSGGDREHVPSAPPPVRHLG